jgi:hypothetical protein
MYRVTICFDDNADYVTYIDVHNGDISPSECCWMIPGTWVED